MAVYCGRCGTQRGYPLSSTRTAGHTPCQFCGGEDVIDKIVAHPNPKLAAEGKTKTKRIPLGNYSYPDSLLPDSPNNPNNISYHS